MPSLQASATAAATAPASPRCGEMQVLHTRSDRFFHQDGHWYFMTREGTRMGPFDDKAEAQLALAYFVERTQWPDTRALRQYIEGCH